MRVEVGWPGLVRDTAARGRSPFETLPLEADVHSGYVRSRETSIRDTSARLRLPFGTLLLEGDVQFIRNCTKLGRHKVPRKMGKTGGRGKRSKVL